MKTTSRPDAIGVVAVGLLVSTVSGAAAQGADFHPTSPDPDAEPDRDGASDTPVEPRAWIRYLTDDGRPRVWYFTRGC